MRKILYVFVFAFVLLIAYEAYAVFCAKHNLLDRFAPYSSMSPSDLGVSEYRLAVLIKIQDPTFYEHNGVEYPSPLTSTTITQSLVKKLFFKKFTKGFKKLEQTLIARFVVNPNVPKETQLVAFMSTAYFGKNGDLQVYGIEQAANSWFNKTLPELTDDEFITLIAMLPSPNNLKPNSEDSLNRVRRIKQVLSGKCTHNHVSDIGLEHCS